MNSKFQSRSRSKAGKNLNFMGDIQKVNNLYLYLIFEATKDYRKMGGFAKKGGLP